MPVTVTRKCYRGYRPAGGIQIGYWAVKIRLSPELCCRRVIYSHYQRRAGHLGQ